MTDIYYRICRNCKKASEARAKMCDHCQQAMPETVEIFFSYAHEDEKLLKELIKHLTILRRTGLGMLWSDQDIGKGSDWRDEIFDHLDTADIILLLISSDFIASDFCYSEEMERAMERHKRNEACVIPVILRDSRWQDAPFAALQGVPKHGKPIEEWSSRDSALLDVVDGIRDVIKKRFGLTPKK